MYPFIHPDSNMSYSALGYCLHCRCPNCGYTKRNYNHEPCIYEVCPMCNHPMMGDIT